MVIGSNGFLLSNAYSLKVANIVETIKSEKLMKAILSHVAFGKQLLSIPKVPPHLQQEALEKAVTIIQTINETLKVNVNDLISGHVSCSGIEAKQNTAGLRKKNCLS